MNNNLINLFLIRKNAIDMLIARNYDKDFLAWSNTRTPLRFN